MEYAQTFIFGVWLWIVVLLFLIADLWLLPPVRPVFVPAQADADNASALVLAHHDLWWAKGHAWTVANWTLATLIALSVVDRDRWPARHEPLLAGALSILTLAANWYLGRMQADMVASRLRATYLIQSDTSLRRSLGPFVAESSPYATGYNRNAGFTRSLMLLASCANGLAVYLLCGDAALARCVAVAQFASGAILQSWQVRSMIHDTLPRLDGVRSQL